MTSSRATALFNTGMRLWTRTQPDIPRAVSCLAEAHFLGSPHAKSKLIELLLNDVDGGDYDVFALYKVAADRNLAYACFYCGSFLAEGIICEQNFDDSITYFAKAQEIDGTPHAIGREIACCLEILTIPEEHLDFILYITDPPTSCQVPRPVLQTLVSDIRMDKYGASVLDMVHKNYLTFKMRKVANDNVASINFNMDTPEGYLLYGVTFLLKDSLFREFISILTVDVDEPKERV